MLGTRLPDLGTGIVIDGGIPMSAVISPKRTGGRVWMTGYDQIKHQQTYEAARRHHMMHVGNRVLTSPERPSEVKIASTNVVGTQTSIAPTSSKKSDTETLISSSSVPSTHPSPVKPPSVSKSSSVSVTQMLSTVSSTEVDNDIRVRELQQQNESLQKMLFDKQIECDGLINRSSQNSVPSPQIVYYNQNSTPNLWTSILPMSERIVHVTSVRPQSTCSCYMLKHYNDVESSLVISGKIIEVFPPTRDSNGSRKLVVVIEGEGGGESEEGLGPNNLNIQLINHWADACSFLSVGDELLVDGFMVQTSQDEHQITSLNRPFIAVLLDTSKVTINRKRIIHLSHENVYTFNYVNDNTIYENTHEISLARGCNQFIKVGCYYDVIFGRKEPFNSIGQHMIKHLTKHGATTILDVGCGTGLLTFFFRYFSIEVTGIDASPIMLNVAKEKLLFLSETEATKKPETRLLIADMTDFSVKLRQFENDEHDERRPWEHLQQFSAATCLDSLSMLPDLSSVRKCIRRIWYHLQVGGILICNIPNIDHGESTKHRQDHSRLSIARTDLTVSAGSMDPGTLDLIIRKYPAVSRKRRVDLIGYVHQKSPNGTKEDYYTSFEDSYTEFLLNYTDFEAILLEERFDILDMYDAVTGGEFKPRVTTKRMYVCRRATTDLECPG